MLCIPEHVALQLALEAESEREVSVADGRKRKVPYVGPIRVEFNGRLCFVGALVLGDEVLLGSVPMEDMDLVIIPGRRSVIPNPESPNIPHARVKASGPDSSRTTSSVAGPRPSYRSGPPRPNRRCAPAPRSFTAPESRLHQRIAASARP
jgi:clan AA aspartic protease